MCEQNGSLADGFSRTRAERPAVNPTSPRSFTTSCTQPFQSSAQRLWCVWGGAEGREWRASDGRCCERLWCGELGAESGRQRAASGGGSHGEGNKLRQCLYGYKLRAAVRVWSLITFRHWMIPPS